MSTTFDEGESAFPLCAVLGGVVHDHLAERLELLARERLGEEVGEVLEALDVLDLDVPGLDELPNLELLAQDVLRTRLSSRRARERRTFSTATSCLKPVCRL